MKYILIILLLSAQFAYAQSDKKIIKGLKESVNYLADDKLEGRRTGSAGEKLAYEYISKKFKKIGLLPRGDKGSYIQPFEVKEGITLTENNFLKIGTETMILHEDYFPMPYAANGTAELPGKVAFETGWLPVGELADSNKSNPHFDMKEAIAEKVRQAEKKGNKIFFISDTAKLNEKFDEKDKTTKAGIPVFYLTASGTNKYIHATKSAQNISYRIETVLKSKQGHNVIGYIDNKAAYTVVLGAHYDHLGYGEDRNSLYTGTTPMIHNGADDNASGTAALIEIGRILKKSAVKKFNFVLVAFSGEELGLYGSKYFADHSPVDLKQVNYMINMDMVGRLNDSTRGITIGGYGTSPVWGEIIGSSDPYFKIKTDSAGNGPSDHTSFYRKEIPVLFFFTGTHSDYHKPTDDAFKINYSGELQIIRYIVSTIQKTAEKDKLPFTKTREAASMGKSSFKVSMGIMPDYTFSGEGVLVDGVSDGKAAQKAGIKAGDVIYQLGEHAVKDVQSYMQALNKFTKGEATKVKIKRGNETLEMGIVF